MGSHGEVSVDGAWVWSRVGNMGIHGRSGRPIGRPYRNRYGEAWTGTYGMCGDAW